MNRSPGNKKGRIQLIQEKKFHLAISLLHHSSPLRRGPFPLSLFLFSMFHALNPQVMGLKAEKQVELSGEEGEIC